MGVLVLYGSVGCGTWLAYFFDKQAARSDSRRIPERTLHLLALAGGWPAALLAQQLLRHKTRKVSFQLVFWVTVVLNCAFLAWLCSATGAQVLRLLP
ncbi:DUF1294 domain-containing protein [Geomonas limicola]|uniref:DUF1294 domain-containing protein n=1 Tax=Geomonas limicola TaxID=2740186 RepID=UPI001FE4C834|nr:DUF1294 domain-containing protein [Geomonas limicola]